MATIIVYSKAQCPYCDRAKALLKQKNAAFDEIRIDQAPDQAKAMIELTGRRTVPQIIINDKPVGGFDDLWALDQAGQLDPLLKG